MKTLAIIPAKGESKGIENKNMALLGGVQLIDYTVKAASDSLLIKHTYLATDGHDMAQHCYRLMPRAFGVVELPNAMASGCVQVDEAVLYILRDLDWEYGGRLSEEFDTIIVLQPTSPFRTAQHIDEALTLYKEVNDSKQPFEEKDIVFSVWEPGWSYSMIGGETYAYAEGYAHDPEKRLGRQDVDSMGYVTENGAIYIVDAERFSKNRTFRSSRMIPYYMDKKSSIEIDEPIDLAMAEAILAHESNS